MKNSKNIYEYLNDTEFNIKDYEIEELSDMEKQRLKKNFNRSIKKKRSFKGLATVAATLVLTTAVVSQTGFGDIIYATTQSKLSEMSYSIGKALGIKKDIEPYSNVVNQVVESNGIEVKLTDVIIDKDELLFSTVVSSDKPMDGFRFEYDIFINGKRIWYEGATGSAGAIDDSKKLFFETYSVDMKEIDRLEDIDIKIVLKDFSYYYLEDTIEKPKDGDVIETTKIKGKWEFEFNANGKELMAKTYVLPMKHSFEIDNTKYTLEEFRYNPVNQKIFGKIENKSEDDYSIDLKGYDNLGNEVRFYLTSASKNDFVFKYLKLEAGGELSDDISSITLTPYAAIQPKESGKMNSDYKQVGEEFTIFLENKTD